jgi:hypothetical protein
MLIPISPVMLPSSSRVGMSSEVPGATLDETASVVGVFGPAGRVSIVRQCAAATKPSSITNCGPMTKHRFIRSTPSVVLKAAYLGHQPLDHHAFDQIEHWRRVAESERGNAVHWYHHVPGIGDVGCCLAVDQGAQSAFAHLTATAPARRGVLPKPLVRLALSSWSYRKLAGLARIAETHSQAP